MSGPACSPRSSGCTPTKAPAGPWPERCRAPSATSTRRSAPYGLFHTADAPVQVACGSEGLWRAFAPVVALDPDDERFASNRLRVERREELTGLIEKAFVQQGAEHWLPILAAAGIPAGKVRTVDDVYTWDQTRSQGLVVEVDHPTIGTIELPGPPLRFDDLPYAGGRDSHLPPPRLGEHNTAVLAWLDEREQSD